MIIATRFRDLPDEQMKHIDRVRRGGQADHRHADGHPRLQHPGRQDLRRSTACNSKDWDGGFGRQILGETWINHHGHHGKESTRGVIAQGMKDHPIVRGCEDIWGPTDVYTVRLPLPGDSKPLVLGQVLEGHEARPTSRSTSKKNDPMMPIAWTKTYKGEQGPDGPGLHHHDGRRQRTWRARACAGCWSTPPTGAWAWRTRSPRGPTSTSSASTSRSYFGFGKFKKGVKPSDHAMP